MTTANKGFNEPAANSPNWDVPLNQNFGYIDAALGGVTTKSATGVGTTPVVLTVAEYRNLILTITGTLTANVTYRFPSGVGGQWIVANNTTGSFTLTIGSAGGGTSVVIPTGGRRTVYSDGTNVYSADNTTSAIGSSGTIIYNDGTGLTGTSGLIYDGSKVTVTATSATTSAGVEVLRINSQSSGTPATGFGPMIAMEGETTPGVSKVGGQIVAAISDVSVGSEDFDFVFRLMAAGAAASEKLRLKSTGSLWVTDIKGITGADDATINGVTVAIASQAEAEAGTDNAKLMTSLRVAEAIPAKLNAAGSAPIYACRAWVNFNGTGTVAIRASGNVTSITDNGSGDYTVNFTTAMPDANYAVVATAENNKGAGSSSSFACLDGEAAQLTTAVTILIKEGSNSGANDRSFVNVAVFR